MEKLKWKLVEKTLVTKGRIHRVLDEKGQGTTEYAILVGVLAVIAMIAIAAFKEKIASLWDAITSGVNGL